MEEDQIPPLLRKLKKPPQEQLGKVPIGYFDDFEKKLMDNLFAEGAEPKVVRIAPKKRRLIPVFIIGIAASVLLLVIAGFWYLRGNNIFDYQSLMAMDIDKGLRKLSLEEADEYLLAHIDELQTEDLLENMSDEELSEAQHASLISFPQNDSLPPAKLKETPKESDPQTVKKPEQPGTMKEELEDDIADESDLDELLKDLGDEELKALEQALLKPKKKPN
jgi:hypothetical protein